MKRRADSTWTWTRTKMTRRIAVDIGNSRVAIGFFDDRKLLETIYYNQYDTKCAINQLKESIANDGVSTVAVSSVVVALKAKFMVELVGKDLRLIEVAHHLQRKVTNIYPTLGTDRLANAVAVLELYVKDKAADAGIVIDFGTATTLTAVSKSGELLGGMITLGLMETLRALHTSLDQLPQTTIQGKFQDGTITPFATNTENAIIHGTVLAHASFVERWIEASQAAIEGTAIIVTTGGLAHFFGRKLTGVDYVDAGLTLKGINLIAAEAEVREDLD